MQNDTSRQPANPSYASCVATTYAIESNAKWDRTHGRQIGPPDFLQSLPRQWLTLCARMFTPFRHMHICRHTTPLLRCTNRPIVQFAVQNILPAWANLHLRYTDGPSLLPPSFIPMSSWASLRGKRLSRLCRGPDRRYGTAE